MFYSKQKKKEHLGFDDTWFMIFGILFLSFLTDFLFSSFSFGRLPFFEALISWGVSLFFTIFYWFTTRWVMVTLRKRYPELGMTLKRVIIFFLAVLTTVWVVDTIGSLILSKAIGVNFNPVKKSQIILPVMLISVMTMAIYEAIYFYEKLRTSIRVEEQAKQAIVQAQLDTLQNQAQPHFFFNTLNTLRDIIDQETKEDAKNFVNKISDVYRFILETGNENLVTLKEELNFARSYLHIQSERFGTNLVVEWNVPEEVMSLLIAPMSLQLLLENAIKHNVISKAKPLTIYVNVKDQQLMVSNLIQAKTSQLISTKLGLKNIEKRYSLLTDRPVSIVDDGSEFRVSIPLLSHNMSSK